ncbi:RsmE family RNA methyltransferase, partial [Ilumatobacter nonamiensis]|uniref:RsmE family RNA methyltransferase n=1 Tax=Ilumatobacter nonamiensis TaxID=467093 RepID=UPI00068725B6
PAELDHDLITAGDEVEHHLRRVLRLREGEQVSVTDGAGRWRVAVARVGGSTLHLEAIGDVVTEERSAPFTLATAVPKGDRLDWLVQKTVEIGVDRIVFVDAERSVVRWKPDRVEKQLGRLRRIADESTRQSRRVWRTELEGPVPAGTVLERAAVAEPGGPPIDAHESLIAIGPEGGWSEAELALAPRRVGLGRNILRTETAAVVATTLRVSL